MSDPKNHADDGFRMVTGTSIVTVNAYGFTALEDTVIAAISFQGIYNGDAAIIGKTLPAGYYPIALDNITLTSGSAIAWRR